MSRGSSVLCVSESATSIETNYEGGRNNAVGRLWSGALSVVHLREVGRRLRDDGVAYAIEWMWDESIPDLVEEAFETPGPHGGPTETSLLMYLEPDLVHGDKLVDALMLREHV